MSGDRIVEAYLKQLTEAAGSLPAQRRGDLVAEVTSHIAEARAAGASSESEVRQMLQQLGDPDDIVAAATDGLVLVEQPPRLRIRDFAALILLFVGPVAVLIGWLAGIWLTWTSDRWTRAEKLLGALAWPLGYAAALAAEVFQPSFWVSIVIVNLVLLAVIAVLAKNARPGRSSAHRTTPAVTTPVASGNH